MAGKRWEQWLWDCLLTLCVFLALFGCDRLRIVPGKIPSLSSEKFNRLWVVTSDYSTGVLIGIDLLDSSVQTLRIGIHSDAIIRVPENNNYFYVVNRLGADNIQVGDRSQKKVLGQFSVGRGTNPQDIAVVNSQVAYVSRLQSKTLLKVNPITGTVIKEINLFEHADIKTISSSDPDGFPEMAWMRVLGNRLLIVMQRLNSEEGFIPSNKSQLAVLDLATDRVEKIVDLRGTNPVTEIKLRDNELSIGEAGTLSVLDGGVEVFDLNMNTKGWVTTEQKLGGDIIDSALLTRETGVAIIAKEIYGPNPITQLVVFRRSDGKMVSILKDLGIYSLHQIVVDEARQIFYVADRNPKKPGVMVYDIKTLSPIFNGYYEVGLPPYHMVLAD